MMRLLVWTALLLVGAKADFRTTALLKCVQKHVETSLEKDQPVVFSGDKRSITNLYRHDMNQWPFSWMAFDQGHQDRMWQVLRTHRMAWKGVTSVYFIHPQDNPISYFNQIWFRFFTGKGLGIADERRMDLMYNNIFYFFVFESQDHFLDHKEAIEAVLTEELNLIAITFNQNNSLAQVWYAKSVPDGLNRLRVVNEYDLNQGLVQKDHLVPPEHQVYANLNGRQFLHPVMHKPPWNYVTLDDDDNFVEDNGGRDVTLFELIGSKMNFTSVSVDPAEHGVKRSRGSSWVEPDYNFTGILGAIHRREKPFHAYLGDTTQTYQRNGAVSYSFFVLYDSGAYVSQAPGNFIPPTLILKPFSLEIWCCIGGSALAVFICALVAEACIHPIKDHDDENKQLHLVKSARTVVGLLYRGLLNQADKTMFHHNEAVSVKLCQIFWFYMCVWVLSPTYSGSLFSFISIPFKKKPMNTLDDLLVQSRINFSIGVTDGSSSYGIMSGGGGIYKDIWDIAEAKNDWLIESVEAGMDRVLRDENFGVIAGREKLKFDTLRLGKENFHINSQVFFPKYKGVVLRNGSPLKSNMDHHLIRFFEHGITGKITDDEYHGVVERRGKFGHLHEAQGQKATRSNSSGAKGLTLNQLSVGFVLASMGVGLSLIVFAFEILQVYLTRKIGSWRMTKFESQPDHGARRVRSMRDTWSASTVDSQTSWKLKYESQQYQPATSNSVESLEAKVDDERDGEVLVRVEGHPRDEVDAERRKDLQDNAKASISDTLEKILNELTN